MNICDSKAGAVTEEHILSRGFKVFDTIKGSDMGQCDYEMPQYQRADGVKIVGGWWSYNIKDKSGNVIFIGWWNSNDEFDETMEHVDYLVQFTPDESEVKRLEDCNKNLLDAIKEHLQNDSSIKALELKFRFGLLSHDEFETFKNFKPNNIKTIDNEFGSITMMTEPMFDVSDQPLIDLETIETNYLNPPKK